MGDEKKAGGPATPVAGRPGVTRRPMPGITLRATRTAATPSRVAPSPGAEQVAVRCSPGGLHLVAEANRPTGGGLHLISLSATELLIAAQAALDPEAQRWLGWPAQTVEAVRRGPRGQSRQGLPVLTPGVLSLGVTAPATIDVVGLFELRQGLLGWEVGGFLAHAVRGRQLGRRAFSMLASFAHHHLGIAEVYAGLASANVASEKALRAAGFETVAGPAEHRLPDRRTVPALWLRHGTPTPALRCDAVEYL